MKNLLQVLGDGGTTGWHPVESLSARIEDPKLDVRFTGCHFQSLVLDDCVLRSLAFTDCTFQSALSLRGARIQHLSLRDCTGSETFDLLADEFVSKTSFLMERVTLRDIHLECSEFLDEPTGETGPCENGDPQVDENPGRGILWKKVEARSLTLEYSQVFPPVLVDGLVFTSHLDFRQTRFGSTVFLNATIWNRKSDEDTGLIDLTEAEGLETAWFEASGLRAGSIRLTQSVWRSGVALSGCELSSDLDLRGGHFNAELSLRNARIGAVYAHGAEIRSADLSGIRVRTDFIAPFLHVPFNPEGERYKDANPSPDGDLVLFDALIEGRLDLHDLRLNSPGRDVSFKRAVVRGDVDLSGGKICAPRVDWTRFECHGSFTLEGTSFVGALPDRNDEARRALPPRNRFRNDLWREIFTSNIPEPGSSHVILANARFHGPFLAPDTQFTSLDLTGIQLECDEIDLQFAQVDGRFRPSQPGDGAEAHRDVAAQYGRIQEVFRRQRRYREEDQAYFWHRFHMAASRPSRLIHWGEKTLLGYMTGYGVRPLRVLVTELILVFLFAGLLSTFFDLSFYWEQEYAATANISAWRGQGLNEMNSGILAHSINFLQALEMSTNFFFSLGIGATDVAHGETGAGIVVAIEGLLGLVLMTVFVGTAIRKFLRLN